ncbi:MAG: PAS domain S-box protein [Anaerolineae bacterium]|nr:PAS domain S-box protein [Anaerolineae bacterium]
MRTLRQFLTPPVFPDDDAKTRIAANLFMITKVSGSAVLVSLPFLLPFFASLPVAILYISLMVILPLLMHLSHKGHPSSAAAIYGVVVWLIVTGGAFNEKGNEASGFIGGTFVMVIVMSLLLGWRGGFGFTILAIVSSLVLAILKINGVLPEARPTPPLGTALGHSVMLVIVAAATYASTKNFTHALRRADIEIAERRKVEEALRISEKRYRQTVENAPNSSIVIYDQDMRYVLIDGPELKTVNLKKEEVEGKTLYEALPPDFVKLVEPDMRAALEGKQFTSELTNMGLTFFYQYVPLRDETGQVTMAMILAQNITERRRLEDELRQYTQQLEQMVEERTAELRAAKEQIEVIIDNTRDGIALVHTNGDVQLANPAFRAMFTDGSAQAIESILNCVAEVVGVESLAEGLVAALLEQQHKALATRIVSSNGNNRDIDLALVPISSDKSVKPSVVLSAHDITQYKELERLKERFVADAVHDLSTPISALAIRLHLLKATPDQLEKHVHSLERQVEHLSHLLEDLQMLSRLDRGVLELERVETDLNTIVQRIFDTYEPIAASKRQSFTCTLDPNLPSCLMDARQMGRVILNLVANAINYTHEGKAITMRTYAEDGRLWFTIQDEGIGMSEFERTHAFDRFFRADQARKEREGGTGLGLAIVKEIIERHGGMVWVESTLGVGSTFTISLPIKPPS